jgi:hypothetical protein
VAMIIGCFLQFNEGRQLSSLINEYKRLMGIKINKMRVNDLLNLVQHGLYCGFCDCIGTIITRIESAHL